MPSSPDNQIDDDTTHVTRRELGLELRSFRNEVRLLVVGAVIVIRFDLPKEVTAVGIALVAAKAIAAFVIRT